MAYKLLFLDLETTGLDPKHNGIIELAGVLDIDGIPEKDFVFRIKPFSQDEIDDKALSVNKITRAQIANFMPAMEAKDELCRLLNRYVDKFDKQDKVHIVAYNAPFDFGFLKEFFLKAGDKYFMSYFHWPALDVAVLASLFLKEKREQIPNFRLHTVAKFLLSPMLEEEFGDKMHGAVYDTWVMREIYYMIQKELKF